jgi:hypothetical protein
VRTLFLARRGRLRNYFEVLPYLDPATGFNLTRTSRLHKQNSTILHYISNYRKRSFTDHNTDKMPAIRHASKRKAPPAGFSDIEDDLLIFSNKMKDAENASTVNVPRHKVHWPIFQISHQRSRYVYELYYEKEAISKELYDWLLKNGYADAMLIAKWKKTGYEKVCFPSLFWLEKELKLMLSSCVV